RPTGPPATGPSAPAAAPLREKDLLLHRHSGPGGICHAPLPFPPALLADPRVHPYRTPGRHRHHRCPRRPALACRAESPRGRQPPEVPEQPQTVGPGPALLPRRQWLPAPGGWSVPNDWNGWWAGEKGSWIVFTLP